MRRVFVALCLASGIASGIASAAPNEQVRDKYKAAAKLAADDDNEAALQLVDQGLAIDAKDLPLLQLRGTLLLKTRDYAGALVAYQAYIDAGARGANKREAVKILTSLGPVKTTFIDLTANTDATIYLDTKSAGTFCTVPCNRPLLPGDYKVIAERAGFDRWTGRVAVAKGTTTKLAVAMVEQPSALALRVTPEGAAVLVDGKGHDGTPLAPGKHELELSLSGHATSKREITAREGKPVELEVALIPLIPLAVTPAEATLSLDGTPIAIESGGLAIPPGTHVVTAKVAGHHEAKLDIPAERPAGYRIELALPPIGTLVEFAGAPSGARIFVDDKPVGTTPLAAPLEVPVGAHAIEVKMSGYRPYTTSAEFAQDSRATLRLGKLRPDNRRRTIIAGAVAGAAVVTGTVFSVLALSRQSDFDARAQLAGVTPDDPMLADARSSGDRFSLIADIGFGLAIVGVAVGAYFFTHEGRGESEGSLQLGIGPTGAVASGRF